jgi:serine/threonine protein kinase
LRLACQIAGGLDAIHSVGLVHADVRSENVIIMTVGEEETAKLKGLEVTGLRETELVGHLIRAGIIPSNPEYATPEQIEGNQVTARTDIYSFGVLLYEMLSGRVPFSASIPDGVLAKHLQEAPVPLGALRREIPSVLELRVKQALEKEPEKRQRYIGDVVNEYLCELAIDELSAERTRQKWGAIGKIAGTVQSRLPKPFAEGETAGIRWKVGAAVALLGLVFVAVMWIFFPVRTAERASPPSLQQPLAAPRAVEREPPVRPDGPASGPSVPASPAEAVQTMPEASETPAGVPEATNDSEPAEEPRKSAEAMGSQPPPLPKESSLRPPGVKHPPQKSRGQPDRSEAPAPPEGMKAPPRVATPPPPAVQRPPSPARDASDPAAIIDWLLEQPSTRP